jgi:hypothetical protein
MGVKEHVVLEVVCDFCKRDVAQGNRKIGNLAVKTEGARGRSSEYQVAFHASCLSKLVDSAGRGGARKSSRKKKTTRRKK